MSRLATLAVIAIVQFAAFVPPPATGLSRRCGMSNEGCGHNQCCVDFGLFQACQEKPGRGDHCDNKCGCRDKFECVDGKCRQHRENTTTTEPTTTTNSTSTAEPTTTSESTTTTEFATTTESG